MELEIIMLNEISHAQKKQITCSHAFVEYRPKMIVGYECIGVAV
jgi:hypothetical protein